MAWYEKRWWKQMWKEKSKVKADVPKDIEAISEFLEDVKRDISESRCLCPEPVLANHLLLRTWREKKEGSPLTCAA